MSEEERIPETSSSASDQKRSDRPLPAVVPPSPGQGLTGFELPEAFRAAGEGGIQGTAWLVALKWVEQQTNTMTNLQGELRGARARNDELMAHLSEERRDNAVLTERLGTRWVAQATGVVGAILVGAAKGLPSVEETVIVAGLGIVLLLISFVDLRRLR